ncbi:hypothetical protein [Nocardioides sp. zg-1230]|uniref:hypothetical protein n=1 Tax=Nocardioides sp. zg-1230 TaxID=2736601 RepID=UPI00155572BB|nr:hypothetical protein [Nocardioides sp. zg-1230]NPC40973.1 hypothetical protein [Nocardioides sp. zg-1230]
MSTSPRRSGARTRPHPAASAVSAAVVALALAAGLAACGDEDGGTATDPARTTSTPTPSETTSESPTETPAESPTKTPSTSMPPESAPIRTTGSAGVSEAVMVSATEGGGSPSTMAMALDTEQAVADFVVGLGAGLPELVSAAVTDVSSPGATPYGAVVSTGCEPPRSVAIDAGEAGFQVVPMLPKNTVQCFAPVTYVVVFAAPDA